MGASRTKLDRETAIISNFYLEIKGKKQQMLNTKSVKKTAEDTDEDQEYSTNATIE
jgi:hypothetical protein